MDPSHYVKLVVDFVQVHQAWAAPIVFTLAFLESLAIVSLLVPAWGALVGIGAISSVSGIPLFPIWMAGALGAALGDWVSYWIGYRFENSIAKVWPLSRYPDVLQQGHAFVERWGVLGIFIGRFFGPLRAVVPLIAGILEMPPLAFQVANFASAFVWVWTLLSLGDLGGHLVSWLAGHPA